MRVLVAMSGGVDSTVAAMLLRDAGWEVGGAYMRMLPPELSASEDGREARRAAERLEIPFYEFDMVSDFREQVLDYFCGSYLGGSTPNPCVVCNRMIKFGAFYREAEKLGYERIATGHYARVLRAGSAPRLLRSAYREKDQSYFLHGLSLSQLERAVFPLEYYDKERVRAAAALFGFENADRKDSQDICFVKGGPGAYADFIEAYTGRKLEHGTFTDPQGRVLGTHEGIARYTIGQRKGVRTAFGRPLYVIAKNAADHTVVMGEDALLYSDTVRVKEFNLLYPDYDPDHLTAKHRYGQPDMPAALSLDGSEAVITFKKPQRAVTPGQFAVVYDGETVVGGGEICE